MDLISYMQSEKLDHINIAHTVGYNFTIYLLIYQSFSRKLNVNIQIKVKLRNQPRTSNKEE